MKATGPGQSSLLLLDVIDILNKSRVPYAVIGAFAASFHGIVRASMDADAVISLRAHQVRAEDIVSNMKAAGLDVVQNQGDAADPVLGAIHITDPFGNRVDLLTGIRGMPGDILSRVVAVDFAGARLRIIGVEDFIAMKIFAGNPRDIEDAKGALKVSAEKINRKLLEQLAAGYGKKELQALRKILTD
ncbi:MAG: nucleotidyltransferase [Candidatus Omnitrophica bacterium]|nr:nucleotidyltransferase [Candidatus Omnitrophota bacterium]